MARSTKKDTSIATDKAAFESIVNSIKATKQLGMVEDLSGQSVEVIPTGMLGLDIATGVGGFPIGRVIEVYGMESCGKSTLMYHLIAEAQKMDKIIPIVVETEGAIDTRYMRRIGVDIDNVIVFSPDAMEPALDFIKEACDAARDGGMRALIVLDSVAALAPMKMMNESAEKQTQSEQARMWAMQMPKILRLLRATNSTLVLVNQMREPRDLYAPPSTPGGKAIKFAASMRVMMRRKIDKNKDQALESSTGQEVTFTIEKNKVSSPYRQGFAFLPAGTRVDIAQDVFARGIERGLIKKGVKFEDGEFVNKANWFTIDPDDDMVKAIKKDLQRLEKNNAEGPSKGGVPILTPEGDPISVYYEKGMMEVLDLAPNLVEALRSRIYDTLVAEAQNVDIEDPFEIALREAVREFDAAANDGISTEKVIAASKRNVVEGASLDDDLAEFANA